MDIFLRNFDSWVLQTECAQSAAQDIGRRNSGTDHFAKPQLNQTVYCYQEQQDGKVQYLASFRVPYHEFAGGHWAGFLPTWADVHPPS